MILVIGATGTIGREVVHLLTQKGHDVRALVHNEERASLICDSGCEMVEGDLLEPETLKDVFKGIEKVFLVTPSGPDQLDMETSAITSAKVNGVVHIVKVSVLGAHPDSPYRLARTHGRIEKLIENSGMTWTHIRPHYFMQNLLYFSRTIKTQDAFFAPMKRGRIGLVDARDIADVAVRCLTRPGHENRAYEITGPESLSFEDIAERISDVTGRDINYIDVPLDSIKRPMIQSGYSEWVTEGMIELYSIWSTDQAADITSNVSRITGHNPIPVDRFIEDNRSAFM